MVYRTRHLFAIALLALLASCAAPPAAAPTSPAGPPVQRTQAKTPAVSLDHHTSHKFNPGVEVEEWRLRIASAQQLTARYLVFHDGNQQKLDEILCNWTEWNEASPDAVARLYLVTQSGEAFGIKNQRVPSLHLEFEGSTPQSMSAKHVSTSLTLATPSFSSQIDSADQISSHPKEPTILYRAYYAPPKGNQSFSGSSNISEMLEASKGGRTIVLVTVDWTPIPAIKK